MPHCNAIPALNDNYIWTIRQNQQAEVGYIVDPGQAEPVLAWLEQTQISLAGILITHHHHDHIGGVAQLVKELSIPVYGPQTISCVTKSVTQQNPLSLPGLDFAFEIVPIPGHTREHIAYFGDNALFCGDTLFAAGCGRIFEGTPEQMLNSLHKLMTTSNDHSQIYCAHEYTMANLRFAQAVLPNDPKIAQRIIDSQKLLDETGCSLPSTMGLEKSTNVFLRCKEPIVQQAVSDHCQLHCDTELKTFAALRQWKNHF